MCEFLTATNVTPIIIDNDSDYPPLLEWYEEGCPYRVIRMEKNFGHLALWKSGLLKLYTDRYYCVSDPDLDLSSIPHDYIDVLMRGLQENPGVTKSGLSLRISDLPQNAYTKKVIEWEKKFWQKKAGSFFLADVDSTFALYDKQIDFGKLPPEGNKFHWAVRSPEPYTVRHLPWYNTPQSIEANEEEKYYFDRTQTYWAERLKETMI